MSNHHQKTGDFVCPITKQVLRRKSRNKAEKEVGAALVNVPVTGAESPFFRNIRAEEVLLREDKIRAYPIVENIPILMGPEVLVPKEEIGMQAIDLKDPRYKEAYLEMNYYDATGKEGTSDISGTEIFEHIKRILNSNTNRSTFPEPYTVWVDSKHDIICQWEAYGHLMPLKGRTVAQIGGSGSHAVKFLLAGAAEAWLVTPMLGEALMARKLARYAGVEDHLHLVVAVAEELPLPDGALDAIYSGGCVHHFYLQAAMPECARVLKKGGHFSAVDPWRHPLYEAGTKIFGRRTGRGVAHCQPLTGKRVIPFQKHFQNTQLCFHGNFLRYPIIALDKLKVPISRELVWKLHQIDDYFSHRVPGLKNTGSTVTLLAQK